MKLKHLRAGLCLLGAAFFSSCVSTGTKAEPSQAPEGIAPVKVALFLDEGSRGNGPFQWTRLLAYSPQIELHLLNGQDVRDGKLEGMQLILSPGGGGAKQIAAMGKEGFEKVKAFVQEGGCYLGICAGSYNAMTRPGRFGFLPYDYIQNAYGKLADLALNFSDEGAKLLGIAPGQRVVRYNGGNVMSPVEGASQSDCQVVAVFKSSVSGYNRAAYNFMDTPAILYGQYGKGKVLACSAHPESYESTHDIALGFIYALTGVRPTPTYPRKAAHPIRVGFMTLPCVGPRATYEMLELDKEPTLDVDLFTLHEIDTGTMRHYDVVVMPDGDKGALTRLFENEFYKGQIHAFLERGGRIVASGNAGGFLPKHENVKVLPVGESFVKHVTK